MSKQRWSSVAEFKARLRAAEASRRVPTFSCRQVAFKVEPVAPPPKPKPIQTYMYTPLIPRLAVALMNMKNSGQEIIDSHTLPCGSSLYRFSNFYILRAKPCGESIGRLSTSDWDAACKGRLG